MRKWLKATLGGVSLLGAGAAALTYVATPKAHAGKPGEAPELGRKGQFNIGTQVIHLTLSNRPRIGIASMLTGSMSDAPRVLNVRVWYPAEADATGAPITYEHEMQLPKRPALAVSSPGYAIASARPLSGQKFPLVVMSHGYGGWNTQFSNLAEHIASRGYVVASIEHADMQADSMTSFLVSFSNVLFDRSLDQRGVIDKLVSMAGSGEGGFASLIDPHRIGLIGYSMGGYGALGSAGASYLFSKDPLSKLPSKAQAMLHEANQKSTPINALILFSPWGGQPDSRAWDVASLGRITVPTLIFVGSEDDVVNYRDGVTWLFDSMANTDRYMLVYREARHNIVGNPFNLGEDNQFAGYEFLAEPVWRNDRLNAVNQHFVTAFLDLNLKDEADKADYLNVPTANSDAAEWPVSFAEQLNGEWAGPEQKSYWRGFQRRWATGMEMHHLRKGEKANSRDLK